MSRPGAWKADLALAAVTIVWGSSFLIVQRAVDRAGALPFSAIRFAVAAAALVLIAPRRFASITRYETIGGLVLGAILGGAYAFQSTGLRFTTTSKAGFITGMSIVLVPIFGLVLRRWPARSALLGICLAAVGMLLVNHHDDEFRFGLGEQMVGVAAFAFGWHIVVQGEFAPTCDAIRLCALQLAGCSIALAIAALVLPAEMDPGQRPVEYDADLWFALLYLAVFASALAFGVQTWAQRTTTPARCALILALEPVVAAVLGVQLAGDHLGPVNQVGCGLILAGILVAEIGKEEG